MDWTRDGADIEEVIREALGDEAGDAAEAGLDGHDDTYRDRLRSADWLDRMAGVEGPLSDKQRGGLRVMGELIRGLAGGEAKLVAMSAAMASVAEEKPGPATGANTPIPGWLALMGRRGQA